MENLKNGSHKEQVEFRMLKIDGSYAVFEGTGIPVFTHGRFAGVQVVARDITDRRRAEEMLKESNEKYLSYIKEAAMRLKTPVEVVEQNITSLIEDIKTGDMNDNQVLLQLQIQVKNIEQIRWNLLNLNKTIVDGYGEISPASKQFLTE